MTHAEDALRAELEERLRFEALLADLSARCVHVPADQVDRMIEEAQRRIVQALGLDRSTLLQRSDEEDDLVITHAWAVPNFAAQPGLYAIRDFPWVHQTLLRGGIVRFSTLEELPAEAGLDKAAFRAIQQKSNLIFPLAALTAYQSAHDAAKLKAGESLLILAASGGVGSFAVQFAKIAGAKVIGLASRKNQAYLKDLGATDTVDYASGDLRAAVKALVPGGVDVVFDCFGADALAKAFDCVKPGGRTVSILVREDTGQAAKAGVHHHYVFVDPNVPELDHIRTLVEAGRLKVHLSATFPLAEAARAHEAMETGHTRGKIVLTM